ncbi:MAG: HAMP domain-containing histidine kinase [Clostridia bacterium]|nr:HAMP domain-containing histidine kinase [Clostridia bacterium]
MTRTNNKSGKEKRPAPLSVKLFRAFALFTFIIVILLWLFQTVLFDSVYGVVKDIDMKNCADFLAENITGKKDDGVITDAAKKYNCCVLVYEIDGNSVKEAGSACLQSACFIHKTDMFDFFGSPTDVFMELYQNAHDSGTYETKKSIDFAGSDKIMTAERNDGASPSSEVLAKYIEVVDGSDYLVIIDSEFTPTSATTRVITYQLIFITLILCAASLLISFIISRKISRPLVKMTKEASLLAKGSYDVDFCNDAFSESKQLGDTLNYAASELSKLDTMQKELIANISHDLRTPLTMIRGYSEVMRDIPGEMNSENIQVIIDETTRLSSLVSDLLDLSKLTEDGAAINKEPFSLTDAVRETLGRYSHLVEREGYRIVFESDGEARVVADKTRILQVIYNLVNNAINYTGEDKNVTVTQQMRDGKVRISVTDTGEGIPEADLPLIWDRFYKGNSFHNRGKVGSGLGLSIVKNVLIKHDAEFGVTSKPGCGSTFWFELDTTE